jgi:hypothetical protein
VICKKVKGEYICFTNRAPGSKLANSSRYSNMDYIILSTLVGVAVCLVVLTYDIVCQWSKNLKRRMEHLPMEMHLKGLQVDCAIPSWHINGHGQSCQQNYCLGYMRGVGCTCGEEIKSSWSHTNPLATSVREMGPAARHEMLNDYWNGFNFRKIVGFGMCLA